MENEPTQKESQTTDNSVTPKHFFNINFKSKGFLIGISLVVCLIVIVGLILVISNINAQKQFKARNDVYQKMKTGDYKGAQQAAKQNLSTYKDDKYLIKNYIDATSSQGNQTGKEKEALKESEPYIQQLLANNDNNVDDLLTAGYAYEAAGKYEKALTYYDKAVTLNPNSSSANFHKGHVLAFLNRRNESRPLLEKAYNLNSNDGYMQLVKGNLLLEDGKLNEAIEMYIKSGENENSNRTQRAEAYTAAAFASSRIGLLNNSLKYSKKASEFDPAFSSGLGLYGFNLVQSGQTSEGVSYLNKAIKLNPRISLNYMMLGVFFRMVGYSKEAIGAQMHGIKNIENDNTLIGAASKKQTLALMYFELAQTHSLALDLPNSIKNLDLAIQNNSTIKDNIPRSITAGYFAYVKDSSDFKNLVK